MAVTLCNIHVLCYIDSIEGPVWAWEDSYWQVESDVELFYSVNLVRLF